MNQITDINKTSKMLKTGMRKARIGISRSHILTYFLLICLSFLFLYPFLFLLITSVKSPKDLQDITVNWVPTTLYIKNYAVAYEYLYYFKFFKKFSGCYCTVCTGKFNFLFYDRLWIFPLSFPWKESAFHAGDFNSHHSSPNNYYSNEYSIL